jgi:hypothetical protein
MRMAASGSQSRSAREDLQGCGTTMMMRTGGSEGAQIIEQDPKAPSRRIIESCSIGTIIVIIMNLCNCLFCAKVSGALGTGQVSPC